MSKAILDIAAERQRQIDKEGFDEKHDDAHVYGQLAQAGACYALQSSLVHGSVLAESDRWHKLFWPWDLKWWKPNNHRRDLVKAGALIVAEIERLDRIEERTNP